MVFTYVKLISCRGCYLVKKKYANLVEEEFMNSFLSNCSVVSEDIKQ
jgi:hypothetical protein